MKAKRIATFYLVLLLPAFLVFPAAANAVELPFDDLYRLEASSRVVEFPGQALPGPIIEVKVILIKEHYFDDMPIPGLGVKVAGHAGISPREIRLLTADGQPITGQSVEVKPTDPGLGRPGSYAVFCHVFFVSAEQLPAPATGNFLRAQARGVVRPLDRAVREEDLVRVPIASAIVKDPRRLVLPLLPAGGDAGK